MPPLTEAGPIHCALLILHQQLPRAVALVSRARRCYKIEHRSVQQNRRIRVDARQGSTNDLAIAFERLPTLMDEDVHRRGAWFTACFRVGMGAVRVITLA